MKENIYLPKWNGKSYDYDGNIQFELNKDNEIIEDKYENILAIFIGENLMKKN
jgi:hypothetical protein